jgi:hypothetical protein
MTTQRGRFSSRTTHARATDALPPWSQPGLVAPPGTAAAPPMGLDTGLAAGGESAGRALPPATPVSWAQAASGDWGQAADWSTGVVPGASNDVTIAVSGGYTVTVTAAEAANSLTVTDAGVDVVDSNTLSLGTTLAMTAGVFTLASGGDVVGGTITVGPNADFAGAGGTLTGVTYQGTLDLSPSGSSLTIAGNTTFAGASGAGTATIDMAANSASILSVIGTATLNNATVDIGSYYGASTLDSIDSGSGAILTLGANLLIDQTYYNAAITGGTSAKDAIINDGSIYAGFAGGVLTINATNFTNNGTITVTNGAFIDLTGTISTALINGINKTGGDVEIDGTVTGGTITATNGGVGGVGGTLSGVSYLGTLDLSPSGSSLTLAGNTTFAGASGAGTATIDISANSASALSVIGTATLNNATIDIGSYYGASTLDSIDSGSGAILTLGANLLIDQTYYDAQIVGGTGAKDAIINDGSIYAGYAGGTLTINATNFTNNGTITVTNGAFIDLTGTISTALINGINKTGGDVEIDGTVTGGTITATNGGVGGAGGTLSGVSYLGTLDLSPSGSSLTLAGNTTFAGASGAGTATIDISANSASALSVIGTATLNNATIDIGSYYGASTLDSIDSGSGAILTLGANLLIDQTYYDAQIVGGTGAKDAIINDGSIYAGYAGGTLTINATNFTNNGTITVTNGAFIDLTGTISTALINGINKTGGDVEIDGTVTGGTITATNGGVGGAGGTLSGVSYLGTLDLSPSGSSLTLAGNTTFAGASGAGTATIDISANSASALSVIGTATLNNATIDIGSYYGASTLDSIDSGSGAILTLGANLLIDQTYYDAQIVGGTGAKDAIINDGSIYAGYAGGTLTINATNFTNAGTMAVANGDTIAFDNALSNLKSGTLTGGVFSVAAGSVFELANNAPITTDAADIILSGAGATIQSLNSSANTQTTLNAKLAVIAAGGTLALLNGQDFVASANNGTFTDSGLLSLGAGTLASTSLSLTAGGHVFGYGTISAAVSNAGSIEASNGNLLLSGSLTGTGALQIDAGSLLELGAGASATETIKFNGTGATLRIDNPNKFTSLLAGYGAGDVVDLAATTLTAVSTSGTLLYAASAAGTTTLTLAAPLANTHLIFGTDGAGGSQITDYSLAQSSLHSPEPVAFGNVHVGASTSQALTLGNTAPANGYSESLDAGIAVASGAVTASGSFSRLAAGASNNTSLLVGLNTSAAGAISGSAIITLESDGTGIDGYGQTSLGTQTVNITGAVYAYAQGSVANKGTLVLGNTHVGQAITGYLSLTNSAAANGYSEALDAYLSALSSGFSGSGTLIGLRAGATNNSTLLLGYTDANAGAFTGAATLNLTSDGTGIDGLGTTMLASQGLVITGAAYAYAKGQAANGGVVVLANSHVGQAVTGYLSLTNSAAANGYSEALDASLATAAAGFTAGGTILGLAAGQTNIDGLQVGYTAAAGGAYSGMATLSLTSDGTGIDGLGTTALASQTVTISGAAYTYAVAQVSSLTINLGVVHVGASDTGTLGIGNAAVANGYSEALDAAWQSATAGLSVSGSITGLAAGATNLSSLLISLATSSSGSFSGQALLNLLSDGTGIDGLGLTSLGLGTITVTGAVDNYAVAAFQDSGGYAISGSGTSFAINLGSTVQGGAALALSIGALNAATGLADLLQGTVSTQGGAGFADTGFGAFGGLGAGTGELLQGVTLTTGSAGVFTETVLLSSAGTNASGYDGALATETLSITGTVYSNGGASNSYTLATGANDIYGADGGDSFIASAGSINSLDSLTGGSGSNTLVLKGGGVFDLGSPSVFTNIQTVAATEGQAAYKKDAATYQTVILRAGSAETVNVAAGKAAAGDKGAETIAIYASTGTAAITLATGADAVFLGGGTDTVTLGAATNSVTAGSGTGLVNATAAVAGAAVVGDASASTTLAITSAGTVTLNAADTYLTVDLAASSKLTLGKLGFISANGGAGADTILAGAANQTLIGGAADVLTGYTGGSDTFYGASAALNGDIVGNWTSGDVIDLTDMNAATLKALAYTDSSKTGTLTVQDGTHSAAIIFSTGTLSLANFTVLGADGHGGTLIGYQT